MAFDPVSLSVGVPAAMTALQALVQGIKSMRGKGPSPFGEQARLEPYREESPIEQKFKERLYPRAQKLLEKQIADLEAPYKSPYDRMGDSPMAPLLMAMAPQFFKDMSGDPEASSMDYLGPLISSLAYQNMPQIADWLKSYASGQQGNVNQPSLPTPESTPGLPRGVRVGKDWPQENIDMLMKAFDAQQRQQDIVNNPMARPMERMRDEEVLNLPYRGRNYTENIVGNNFYDQWPRYRD
jgi:hypothetical protein